MLNHGDMRIINQEGGDKIPPSVSKGGGGGATRSCGTTVSGQSMSTSGSVGSTLSQSEAAATIPSNRMKNLDIQGEDAGSRGLLEDKKKIKLSDFCLAREEADDEMTTEAGRYRWMTPEASWAGHIKLQSCCLFDGLGVYVKKIQNKKMADDSFVTSVIQISIRILNFE